MGADFAFEEIAKAHQIMESGQVGRQARRQGRITGTRWQTARGQRATGVQASWSNENYTELTTNSATLAIASTRTVPLFALGAARPADNNTGSWRR